MSTEALTGLFTSIANAIRSKSGTSSQMMPREMGNVIRSIKNVPQTPQQGTLNGIFQDMADAIRACGVAGTMTPLQMPDKILLIPAQQSSLVIQAEDVFTGKTAYCKAYYNDQLVAASWSISSGGSYATINSNGRIDVVSGTVSKSITVSCTYDGNTVTKTMTVSYDNQLSIQCADTLSGTDGNVVVTYNGEFVAPNLVTFTIASGGSHASIDSNGTITITSSGTIVLQVSYNGYTTNKSIVLNYIANTSSQTTVNDDGSVTTETQTTTQNQDGSTTTETTSTTTNEDGSYSQTESTTVTQQDGSSTTTSTTTNQDGSSSETNQNVAADGSSTAQTTNYNSEGNPVSGENVTTDTSGNENTQEVEYDSGGNQVVTGYTIDTTNNESGGETLRSGVDTGMLVFDGRSWEATLEAKILFSDVTTGEHPIINVASMGDNNKLDGAYFKIIKVTSGQGSNCYDETGKQQTTTSSSNPSVKWRVQSYLNGSIQTGIDFYYNNGTRPFYTNRFISKSTSTTLKYKMTFDASTHLLTTEIYNGNNLIAKPRSEATIQFSRVLNDVTFKIGKGESSSGRPITLKMEVLSFNVKKL